MMRQFNDKKYFFTLLTVLSIQGCDSLEVGCSVDSGLVDYNLDLKSIQFALPTRTIQLTSDIKAEFLPLNVRSGTQDITVIISNRSEKIRYIANARLKYSDHENMSSSDAYTLSCQGRSCTRSYLLGNNSLPLESDMDIFMRFRFDELPDSGPEVQEFLTIQLSDEEKISHETTLKLVQKRYNCLLGSGHSYR